MIPLRLMLENFMCYRERTEISFRGSTTWALSGHNGSGKSTMFDAIRYVLYGEHRAGRQKADTLIHRGTNPASSFMIEFDFAIGENEYRVQRTYSQKKKGTTLALHLAGPDAPNPGRSGPQLIQGTETKEQFDSWILKTIGLDELAFTVSVLLLQGQSDKLLKLGGPERHEVLTHIIDLSRYDALAKRMQEKQRAQDSDTKAYKRLLDGLEKVDETSIGTIEQQARKLQIEKEQARQRQLALATFKEQARSWQQLQEDEKHLLQELARFEQLLAHSEQIEHDAAQLVTLQQIIQPLTQIQQKQVERGRVQLEIEQGQKRATSLEANRQRICIEWQEVQQKLKNARTCHQTQSQEYQTIQADLLTLEVPCNDIGRLHKKQQAYQELLDHLSTFAPDLEQQQHHLRERLDEIEGIETAIPLLKSFTRFRNEWRQTTQDLDKITQNLQNHKIAQKQITNQLQALHKTYETIREQADQRQSKVASQKTLLTECQKRFDRFHTIEESATCSYCGQPLTMEHLDTERQHIQEELQKREHDLQICEISYNADRQQQKTIKQEIEQAQQREQQQQQEYEELTQQENIVVRKRDTAYIEARHQLELLAPKYLELIQGPVNTLIDMDVCLRSTYPTPQDQDALSLQQRDKSTLNQKLHAVEDALTQRQKICRKQEHMHSEIEPLLQIYPPERARDLLEKQKQASQRSVDLSAILPTLSLEINQQENYVSQLTDEEQSTKEEQNNLSETLAIARTNFQNIEQTIAEIQGQLPAEWQAHIPHLSLEMLAKWQQEIRELQGATEQYQALVEARQRQSLHRQTLVEVGSKLQQLPKEAQRMPDQVQQEMDQINISHQLLEKQEQTCRAEIQRLQGIRERHQELQHQWAEAARLASRYKELAHLLGREGLQHYLMQNAEIGIIYHANETLDRISGGTLRLELRPSSESRTKTLDMVAYNSAISAREPQSIELLSGSQQFRIAISLAIGIGKYMGNANHRVESLMIDEGFGSLDVDSRDEMIQTLQTLESDFKCVIVVSHQNEFSDKFPNRYEAQLVDGQTKITLA